VSRPRLIAIVGPTAAGKSEHAVEVAQALGGEIVSVDSRQVYRRLDVGTAKPSAALRRAVPHHLLDVVELDERYDAARFASDARTAITAILARGRAVVLCGGSGLYLRALTDGLCPAPPADPGLRSELRSAAERRGASALHDDLRGVDPELAARLAPRDLPRVVRALEVARLTGRPLSAWQEEHRFGDRPYDVLAIVLSPPLATLEARIAARARAMWERGLVEETVALLAAGFSPDLAPLKSIGYGQAQAHLRGELDRAASVEATILATRRYAKRQRTWFRSLPGALWIDAAAPHAETRSRVERFLAGEDRDAAHVS